MYLKSTMIGRIGQKPVPRTTQGGAKFVTFSVAVSLYRGKERGKETQWVDVAIWNEKQGDFIEQYAEKGSTVMVEGEPSARHFTGKDGETKSTLSITVGRFDGNVVLMGGGEPSNSVETKPKAQDNAPLGPSELPPGWE